MRQNKGQNLKTYDREADKLHQSYNAVTTDEILPKFTARIDALGDVRGLSALDIGCGSGRDASWLASQGFKVAACDGAQGMIDAARQDNAHAQIDYYVDTAPDFTQTRQRGEKFDVILMNAFIFHFDYKGKNSPLNQLFTHVVGLGQSGALIYTNLRHGPIPEGRVMYDIPPHVVEDLSAHNGLTYEYLGRSADGLCRKDVTWSDIVLTCPV